MNIIPVECAQFIQNWEEICIFEHVQRGTMNLVQIDLLSVQTSQTVFQVASDQFFRIVGRVIDD